MTDQSITKNEKERDYRAYLVIGGKGQGKSTWLNQRAEEYIRKFSVKYKYSPPRVFIHDMSDSRAFKGIPTLDQAATHLGLELEDPIEFLAHKDKHGKYSWKEGMLRHVCRSQTDIKKMYRYLADHFRCGLLILDEWTTYVRANPPEWQVDILNNHRNYQLEVFFVCHQLMRVPPFWSRGDMIAKIVLFKTGERNLTYNQLRRYSCSDRLWESFQRIMKKPKINERIQYHEVISTEI